MIANSDTISHSFFGIVDSDFFEKGEKMRFLKNWFALFGGSLLFSLSLHAEMLDVTKQTPVQQMFPNSYSNVLLRNYQQTDSKKPTILNQTWQLRYTLGATFFNEMMDTRLVLGMNKTGDSILLKDRGTRVETTWQLYSNDYIEWIPYLEIHFPTKAGKGYRVIPGMATKVSYSWETTWGDVSWSAGHDVWAYFGTKPTTVAVTEGGKVIQASAVPAALQEKLNLVVSDQQLLAEQRSPSIKQELSVGVFWSVAAVKGLWLTLKRYYFITKDPQMTYDTKSGTVTMPTTSGVFNMPQYQTTTQRWDRLGLGYELTETMTLAADAYLGTRLNGKRQYQVISSLEMALF